MTERKSLESERAELVALNEWMREPDYAENFSLADITDWINRRPIATVARLAAQDQKPVAWQFQAANGKWSICATPDETDFVKFPERLRALYLSPPSAAGWDEATGYAERLAVALWEKHYKDDAPQWGPLSGDLIGILTQIDNMTAGLSRTTPAATKSADTGGERSLTDDEHDRIVDAVMASGTVIGSLPDHGGADAGVGETLTLDDALEDLHDLLVAGATGEDIKIFAAEHPQFSDQIFAFTEAWFSAGESDE